VAISASAVMIAVGLSLLLLIKVIERWVKTGGG